MYVCRKTKSGTLNEHLRLWEKSKYLIVHDECNLPKAFNYRTLRIKQGSPVPLFRISFKKKQKKKNGKSVSFFKGI